MSVHHFDMWWYATGQRPTEIHAHPFTPPWADGPRRFGYSMRATLADGTHVHYLSSRALSRPQTSWPGTLAIVGEEGTLEWDGSGAAVTLIRELPTHNYRDQHLARGPVSYVSYESPRDTVGGPGSAHSSTMQMVRALIAAQREGRPHPNDLDDNWVSFATAMAAVEVGSDRAAGAGGDRIASRAVGVPSAAPALPQHRLDRRRGDFGAEFEEFAADAPASQGGVLPRQAQDQVTDLRRRRGRPGPRR